MKNNDIHLICNQLKQQGKTPSVALIKARLSSPMPLPQVIQAFKAWQQNPDAENSVTPEVNEQSQLSLEQRVEQLEQHVLTLSQQLAQLTK